ncbi:PSD1 and planctomycete cytochrome C domain-containing protein [Stieleria sp. TO1_6]|uniref:PSD1 and planctomycete cytochrome C domain-containing protein n=1 Tax=Stieleria tagensis TaxID=2956795 RepID=UPI00209B8FB2|nr:PSD1 and planctomycete cytochrome C domain-containing protein [Stieleria tagensis]MCO8124548.1 PSD1 and planctomycete cytochrome C domain-containing protein [Stieleria tagensis]
MQDRNLKTSHWRCVINRIDDIPSLHSQNQQQEAADTMLPPSSIARLTIILSVMLTMLTFPLPETIGEETSAAERSEILFVRRIAPLFRDKCMACHGGDPEMIEGSLDLRSASVLERGGESGEPAVTPNKPNESAIYLASRRDHDDWPAMPPKEAEKLDDEQLKWMREWIETGAVWPDTDRRTEIESTHANKWSSEDGVPVKTSGGLASDWTNRKYDPEGLWAYQPVKNVELSTADGKNAIDVLIAKRLPDGLSVASPASRQVLIRRATFNLTGLPPTPEEIDAFVADKRTDAKAFETVVDRLLNSPRYGERMAQHWLDVVRYADSSGFANDYERGNAWRYRDYVIRSFNNDKPYDQFIREQIAGDEINPDDPEMVVAAGFLRMGPWELTGMEVPKVARQRFLDDVTNSVGETFFGHSLQCARCHDHKFDPVPTRDYYSIQAVFATTQIADRKAAFLDDENTSGFEEQEILQKRRQAYIDVLVETHAQLLKNAQAWFNQRLHDASKNEKKVIRQQKKRWDDAIAKATEEKRIEPFGYVRTQFRKQNIPQEEYPPKQVGLTPDQIGTNVVARKGMERLKWEMDRYQPFALSVYNGHTPKIDAVYAPLRMPKDRTSGELEHSCIHTGGDPFAQGEPVAPGTLSVVNDLVSVEIPRSIDGRRTAFANWVADPNNPLTTRVIVNRLWLWHFGKPLAANPNNFGATGGKPTHPQLLDYLASTFVEDGWSIKKLHRRILLSEAYRRSSAHRAPERLAKLDPLGHSYAVFHPRRLSAEELRDGMLSVSGELNAKLGGIPCRPEINIEVALQPRMVMGTFAPAWVPNPKPQQRHRRSIYVTRLRGLMHPMLEVFNSPAPDFSCERREASTVTPQVFSLFNGQNTYSRALALANRVWKAVEKSTPDDRNAEAIEQCFLLTLGRRPTQEESGELLAHWKTLEESLPAKARPSPPVLLTVKREAVEENTGEDFSFQEQLFANQAFEPDLQPSEVDRHVRALADLCLVILNCNEFVYVY